MKRTLSFTAILLSLLLILSCFTACGGSSSSSADNDYDAAAVQDYDDEQKDEQKDTQASAEASDNGIIPKIDLEDITVPEKAGSTAAASTVDFAEDFNSFRVNLNGHIISFPTTVDTFLNLGWQYEDPAQSTVMLAADETLEDVILTNGSNQIGIVFWNNTNASAFVSDCEIHAFYVIDEVFTQGSVTVPGNFALGAAKKDALTAAYDPHFSGLNRQEDDGFVCYIEQKEDTNWFLYFVFDEDTDRLIEIAILSEGFIDKL